MPRGRVWGGECAAQPTQPPASINVLPLLIEHAPTQISMYINSPGGVVTAGLAIYDTMQVRQQEEAGGLAVERVSVDASH